MGLLGTPSEPPRSLNLRDCFNYTLGRSEALKIESEALFQLEQTYRTTRAAILPDLRFIFLETIQDQTGVARRSSGDSGNSNNNNNTRADRPEARFTVQQPLFSGFREFNTLSALKSERRRQELQLKFDTNRLFLLVARAFYAAITAETNVLELQNLLKLTEDRAKELTGRINLGKSRRSELLTIQSDVAAIKAARETLLEQVSFARDDLAFLTGLEMEGVALINDPLSLVNNETASQLLVKAEARSDIRALQEEVTAQRRLVAAARGRLSPSLDLTGNYYLKRTGSQEPIDWDLIFSLDMPLFVGGANRAAIATAQSALRVAELNLSSVRRQAHREIKQANTAYQASLSRADFLKVATEKSRESYDMQVKEYRYGLVNNLEVLAALRSMVQNHQNQETAALESQLRLIELKVATEELP